MRMQGQLLPELSEIAVLRTKNAVLHSLSVLALQVAETASKEVVFVVQAVAPALDVSRVSKISPISLLTHLSLAGLVDAQLLYPVCVAQRVQRVFTAAQAWRYHGDLKRESDFRETQKINTGNDVYSGKNGQAPEVRYSGRFR